MRFFRVDILAMYASISYFATENLLLLIVMRLHLFTTADEYEKKQLGDEQKQTRAREETTKSIINKTKET